MILRKWGNMGGERLRIACFMRRDTLAVRESSNGYRVYEGSTKCRRPVLALRGVRAVRFRRSDVGRWCLPPLSRVRDSRARGSHHIRLLE